MQEALLFVVCNFQGQGLSVARRKNPKGRKEKKMKVKVDEETCVEDETCVQICPEIVEMKGDVAVAKMEEVPKDLEESVKRRPGPVQ
jgi:ferredoxin